MTWRFMIDVSNIFHNEDMTLLAKGYAIANRIRISDWYLGDEKRELELELQRLEHAGNNAWLFDESWNHIYDMADRDLVLIITQEDHQNERGTTNQAGSPTTRDA